jgi:hypothetical protein
MRHTVILLAIFVASSASAQVAMPGPSVVAVNRPTARAVVFQEGVQLRGGDIERLNPARVILDRDEELKLEKAQIVRLDSLRKAFDANAKRMAEDVKKYQRAVTTPPPMLKRPPEGKPETRKDSLARAKLDSTNRMKRDSYFETVTAGRRDLAATLLALKELFDAHLTSTIAALNGSQHTAAALSLERASEEFTRRLRMANVR